MPRGSAPLLPPWLRAPAASVAPRPCCPRDSAALLRGSAVLLAQRPCRLRDTAGSAPLLPLLAPRPCWLCGTAMNALSDNPKLMIAQIENNIVNKI